MIKCEHEFWKGAYMTKKEIIEKLRQNMPEGLNDVAMAKYIYIELGKIKSFDMRFYYGNSEIRRKMYKLAERARIDTEHVAEGKNIVCLSLSYLYRDILKEFGIKCTVYEEDAEEEYNHAYNIIFLKDGRKIKADLQRDLANVQTRSRTREFGELPEYGADVNIYQISDEEMLQIDQSIGYINSAEDYRDSYIEEVKEEVKDMSVEEAMSAVLNNPKIYDIQENMGYSELRAYYKSVFAKTMPGCLGRKMYLINCYRTLEDGTRDYTMCAFATNKEKATTLLFSQKYNRFINISLEELSKLEEGGLVLGRSQKEEGLKLLKKQIKRDKALQSKNSVYSEDGGR